MNGGCLDCGSDFAPMAPAPLVPFEPARLESEPAPGTVVVQTRDSNPWPLVAAVLVILIIAGGK